MAFNLVQTVTKTAAGSSSLTTSNFTSTSGNTLIVVASIGANSSLFDGFDTITDNKSNTFTRVVTRGTSSGSGNTVDIWYCSNITGGALHTVSGAYPEVGGVGLIVMEWLGALTVDRVAGQTESSSGTTITTGPTQLLTFIPELIVAATIGNPGDTGVGAAYSNYTQINVQGHPTASESREAAVSDSAPGEFTSDVGNAYAAAVATFYAAGATSTSTSSSTSMSTSSTSASTSSTSTSLSTSTTIMALDYKPRGFIRKWR